MPNSSTDQLLVAIAGPTGSGKSELALRVAEEFGGEVVNCDSLQVYRHFDIGTAKLPVEERRGVPHHMLDVIDPGEPFSAGEYARRSRAAAGGDYRARPAAHGGRRHGLLPARPSGRAVPGPCPRRCPALPSGGAGGPQARARSTACSAGSTRAAAQRIHARDIHKLIRALEICLLTRRSLSDAFAAGRDCLQGYRPLKIGINPPREALYERLDARCQRMFDQGLVDEVRRILLLGFPPEAKPLESHGYRQALQFLRGELSLEDAVLEAQTNTRRYAKRQGTWFRREPGLEWFNGFGDQPEVQAAVIARVALAAERG